jgi:hypothetical protein
MLFLLPYEIRQVQATEDDNYERTHFSNWFLHSAHDGFLDPKLTFLTNEAWFYLSEYIGVQTNRYCSSNNLRQTFQVSLHNQKI